MSTPTITSDEVIHDQLSAAREVVNGVPRQAVREGREAADDRVRKYWWPRIVIAAAIAAIIASAATAYVTISVFGTQLANATTTQAARDAGQDAAQQELRARAVVAQQQGAAANDQLVGRGLAPVDVPTIAEGASDYEVLSASIVPVVLAQLSKSLPDVPAGTQVEQQVLAPTANQVADALAQYLAVNPVVVSPQDIADQVATYLAANPAQAGPPGAVGPQGAEGPAGERGAQGDPPTADQIMAAFSTAVAANPSLLCPAGGAYGTVTLITTGGTTPAFGCFGDTIAPQPPNTTDPDPDPTPDPDPPAANSNADPDGPAVVNPPATTQNPAPTTDPTTDPTTTPPADGGGLLDGLLGD